MLLYLDTLKKMCFQKKKKNKERKRERCHFMWTTSNCDFILWFGEWAEGGRRSHFRFQLTQAHIRSRLFTSGWACSSCMDHGVAIFGKQCDGGAGNLAFYLFKIVSIQWYCDKLMFTCIVFDKVPPKLLCFWLFTNRQLQRGGLYGFHTSRQQRSILMAAGGGTTMADR